MGLLNWPANEWNGKSNEGGIMDESMMFWLSFYFSFLAMSTYVGFKKNNLVAGVLLGYVLGPIGFMLLLLSFDRKQGRCPHCSAKIDRQSYICPSCEEKCYKQVI